VEHSNLTNERRAKARFPVVQDVQVRYRSKNTLGGLCGLGETVNISSSGTLFTIDRELKPGTSVELSISWPMKLNEVIAVKLVAGATIVRVGEGKAAAQFETHEFRLAGLKRKSAVSAA
jgi:hypothetical protein